MNYNKRPLFEFYLNVWFFRVHTALWRDVLNEDSRDYVMVFFDVRGRQREVLKGFTDPWINLFKFRLYQTGLRLLESHR